MQPSRLRQGARYKMLRYYSKELDSYMYFTMEDIFEFRWSHTDKKLVGKRSIKAPDSFPFFLFRGKVYPNVKLAGMEHGLGEKNTALLREVKRFKLVRA